MYICLKNKQNEHTYLRFACSNPAAHNNLYPKSSIRNLSCNFKSSSSLFQITKFRTSTGNFPS